VVASFNGLAVDRVLRILDRTRSRLDAALAVLA
jgi:hypothetical protein